MPNLLTVQAKTWKTLRKIADLTLLDIWAETGIPLVQTWHEDEDFKYCTFSWETGVFTPDKEDIA
jgi:hypothetical protein